MPIRNSLGSLKQSEQSVPLYSGTGWIYFYKYATLPSATTFTIQRTITDSDGYIYVAGGQTSASDSYEYGFISKLNPDGSLIWMKKITTTSDTIYLNYMVKDSSNQLHFISSLPSGTDSEYIKLNATDGSVLFSCKLTNLSISGMIGYDEEIVDNPCFDIDSAGNLFIIGDSTSADRLLVKYDSNMDPIKKILLSESTPYGRSLSIIKIDNFGNIIVTNSDGTDPAIGSKLTVLKFDNNLNLLWQYTYNSALSPFAEEFYVAIDSNNNYYFKYVDKASNKIALLKTDSDGSVLDRYTYTNLLDGDVKNITIINNSIYLMSENSYLVKINSANGKIYWIRQLTFGGARYTTPTVTHMSVNPASKSLTIAVNYYQNGGGPSIPKFGNMPGVYNVPSDGRIPIDGNYEFPPMVVPTDFGGTVTANYVFSYLQSTLIKTFSVGTSIKTSSSISISTYTGTDGDKNTKTVTSTNLTFTTPLINIGE